MIVDILQQLSPRQCRLYEQLHAEDAQATGNSGLSAQPEPGTEGDDGPWRQPVFRGEACLWEAAMFFTDRADAG